MEELVILGRIAMVHGVHGLLKVQSFTENPSDITNYHEFFIGNDKKGWQQFEVVRCNPHGKYLLLELAGLSDRTQAETFKGLEIAVPKEALPPKEEDQYFWTELVGLKVVTTTGVELGIIDYLFETGSNDVIVIKGERERYVPYLIGDVIESVDLEKGLMVVNWDPEF